MALQLKAPETLRFVEEVSRRTGETSETAVQVAMQERLERLPPPVPQRTPDEEAERRAEIYTLVRELQEAFKKHPEAIVDHAELLYGEDGLPK